MAWTRIVVLGILALALAGRPLAASASQEATGNLMPVPARVSFESGGLPLDAHFGVKVEGSSDPRIQRAVERLLVRMTRLTGIPFVRSGGKALLTVTCLHARTGTQKAIEDESYSLRIAPDGADLRAPTVYGVLRGLETFSQLIEPAAPGFVVRAATIDDHPRFPWRGLLIDVCRHWMPVEVIERNLDAMAAVKLNVLHWHLSEDQGFRVESHVFPRLQGMGSDGLYYTQEQVREVVRYAADRGIRVVPEFDMPAHTLAWLVGYPELSAGKGPFELARRWGVFDPVLDPSSERTYAFLGRLLTEMTALFPDAYFHIGGDEVNGKQWDASPAVAAFKTRHALKTNDDLQAYFNRRIAALLKARGKTMVGWDEVLHKDLPKTAVVQSWRGQKSLADAALAGFGGILSNGYYLDYMWPASRHYAVDPAGKDAAALPDEAKARILGGEACMWAEWVTPETIDSRIWPRMAAVAERFWSPATLTDPDDMYRRLAIVSQRLDSTGVLHRSNYETMLARLAYPSQTDAVRRLVDLVEPVKNYDRGKHGNLTSLSALVGIVDAARPESDAARAFARQVDALLADPGRTVGRAELAATLKQWQADARAASAQMGGPLLADAAPLAASWEALADLGLKALEAMEAHRPLVLAAGDTEALKQASAPAADVMLMIAAPVRKLIDAAR